MPNLKNCKQDANGKIYCWDSKSEIFREVTLMPIHISQVPKEVIIAFLKDIYPFEKDEE